MGGLHRNRGRKKRNNEEKGIFEPKPIRNQFYETRQALPL